MCDDITEFENQGFYEKKLTRRDFNLMAGGAAISIAFAGCAPGETASTKTGDSITESDVMIETPDGTADAYFCLLYTSPSPRDATLSRMPSSA